MKTSLTMSLFFMLNMFTSSVEAKPHDGIAAIDAVAKDCLIGLNEFSYKNFKSAAKNRGYDILQTDLLTSDYLADYGRATAKQREKICISVRKYVQVNKLNTKPKPTAGITRKSVEQFVFVSVAGKFCGTSFDLPKLSYWEIIAKQEFSEYDKVRLEKGAEVRKMLDDLGLMSELVCLRVERIARSWGLLKK